MQLAEPANTGSPDRKPRSQRWMRGFSFMHRIQHRHGLKIADAGKPCCYGNVAPAL
jgi:hypothetical protein